MVSHSCIKSLTYCGGAINELLHSLSARLRIEAEKYVCICVSDCPHERVDGRRPNLVGMGDGYPLEVIKF